MTVTLLSSVMPTITHLTVTLTPHPRCLQLLLLMLENKHDIPWVELFTRSPSEAVGPLAPWVVHSMFAGLVRTPLIERALE